MDVLSVHNACKYAKEWTTAGKGPLLLEFITYRYGGHSMSDPGTTYRTREEIQHMRSTNDPITGLRNRMLESGVVEEAELKKIDKAAKAEVDVAVEEAKQSPEPDINKVCQKLRYAMIFLLGCEVETLTREWLAVCSCRTCGRTCTSKALLLNG